MNNKYLAKFCDKIIDNPKVFLLFEKNKDVDMAIELQINSDENVIIFDKFDSNYVDILKKKKKCDYVIYRENDDEFYIYLIELKKKINTSTLENKIIEQLSNGLIISSMFMDHFNNSRKNIKVVPLCIYQEDQIDVELLSDKVEITGDTDDFLVDSYAVDWDNSKIILNSLEFDLAKINCNTFSKDNPLITQLKNIR